jgi:O-acetyl-ADP-ribose deacetylase (regulator of RNase III)
MTGDPYARIRIVDGDLTRITADAIVTSADSALSGGGGVDRAVYRAGGPGIKEDLVRRYGTAIGCPTGSALVSSAGLLEARWLIHAVGPVWWGGGAGEAGLLASAYLTSLRLADDLGARHVAFPSISTGAYGYPIELAAPVALEAVAKALREARSIGRVTFVLHTETALAVYETALAELVERGSA